MTSKVWSRQLVAEKRKQERKPQDSAVTETRLSSEGKYHDAAAVLSSFEINRTLQPVGRDVDGENVELERLISNSILVSEIGQPRLWTLKNDIRKQVLRRLGTRNALVSALNANLSRPQDPLQKTLELYVFGGAKKLAEQTPEELSSTLQVTDWLGETELRDGLPTQDEVRRWVEVSTLLSPFRALVGDHFRGRTRELHLLREYVEVLEPQSRGASVRRALRKIMSLREKPPLLIWGPGGIGKSTLLAKFILEHTSDPDARFPFLYLDCDRPGLDPKEPVTFLLEAVRQLGIEFPEHSTSCDALRKGWLTRLSNQAVSQISESFSLRGRHEFIEEFRLLVDELGIREKPLLLVLDTFEEVQFRSQDSVTELWRFLDELQGVVPQTRTVIAGRARIHDLSVEELPLSKLDLDAAQGFLMALGITDLPLARIVAEQMQGNPLSLRLAAQVLRRESGSQEGVQDIKTREWWGQKVDDSRIQGQLYARILKHVHDEDVRKLAHPGLILRRITPDVIRLILAEPCGLGEVTPARALQLFNSLKREVSLVTASSSDPMELHHRTDVRRVMLHLMRSEDIERAKAIHIKAVDFYKSQQPDSAISRAEEIYHRLSLEQPSSDVDPRFFPGVEAYLQTAIEELPASVQPYLASRLGVELDVSWEKSDLATWEAYAKRRANGLLQLERPEEALQILRKRDERSPGSSLYALEAQALERLGRLREAGIIARTGLKTFGPEQDIEILKLSALVARTDELLGEIFNPTELVQFFRKLKTQFPSELDLVLIGLSYIRRLSKLDSLSRQDTLDDMRRELLQFVREIPSEQLRALGVSEELSALFQTDDPAFAQALISHDLLSSSPESVNVNEFIYDGSAEEKDLLRSVLLQRYSTRALLSGAVSSILGVSLSQILGLESGTLEMAVVRVLDWADQQGLTPKLIEGLCRQFPDDASLRHFRRSGGDRIAIQSVEGLISGSRPFIGRQELRKWVRQLDERRSPVLVVNGPRGSGKSYTIAFLQHFASQTEKFDLISTELYPPKQSSVFEFAQTIATNASLNPQSLPAPKSTSGDRYVKELAAWLGAQVQRRRRPLLVCVDNWDDVDVNPEIVSYTQEVTRVCTRGRNLLLVLLGFPPRYIPKDCEPFVTKEDLKPLSNPDVEQFLDQLASAGVLPESELPGVKKNILAGVSATPDAYNRVLQERLSVLIKQLANEAT